MNLTYFLKKADECEENLNFYSKSNKVWFEDQSTCNNKKIKSEKCNNIYLKIEKKYTCIFFHGVGVKETLPLRNESFQEYWGQVHEHTEQCHKRYFVQEETLMRGWDNKTLQKSFCQAALINQNINDTIIKNKILFLHSMGNLILAAGINNKFCEIDLNSTSWYSIQAPILGSKAANYITRICKGDWNGMVNWAVHYIAYYGGYCFNNDTYPAYKTLDPNYKGIKDLFQTAKNRVKGILCGKDSYGLHTRYGIILYALDTVVGFKEPNDGMVSFSSCNLNITNFLDDYDSNFYKSNINHADGSMRNNNGWWGTDRKPLSWISKRKGI